MSHRHDLRFARVCIFLALLASIAFRAPQIVRGQDEAGAEVTLELVQTVPSETELTTIISSALT